MARLTYAYTAVLSALAFSLSHLLPTALAGTPSPGCGKQPTLTSPEAYNVTVNGKTRSFYIRLPADGAYDAAHAYKLIFTFHALGGTAEQVVSGAGGYLPWYGLPAADGTESAIYVAAQGLTNDAEFGGALPGWANVGGEDLALVDAILAAVEADLCVDADHRYSTGFSYGGAMSYALACDRSALFRAVAVLSGGPMSGCGGEDGLPVAYYGEHGVSDPVLPMALGRELRDRFVANSGCAPREAAEPAAGSGTHVKTVYEGCTHPVTFVAFDGDHTPLPMDAGAEQSYAPDETWAFFSQFAQT
ncbi:hypothetical protein SLS62_004885 [Diatrype stigma]|uniref:Feruloyl esterase C n=1 Tax=Diatrype stigma TaxID=117547 RepID=A0AAN9YSP9_9PEZI